MLTRSLDQAREAYKNKNPELSKKAHSQISAEERHQTSGQYIKSLIYGGLDGTITTFAVVAGVAGANLSTGIVLIMGFANLLADGLSMAIGDFLSTKAENEYNSAEKEREKWEVENFPEGEKKELVELYVEKGLPQKDAEAVTEIFSRHKKAWVEIMMVEELGIVENLSSPLKNALVTFFSFLIFGFVPVGIYLIAKFIPGLNNHLFLLDCLLTSLTLFILGSLKTKITNRNWFLSGLEMLIVGGLAATAAYGVGALLG